MNYSLGFGMHAVRRMLTFLVLVGLTACSTSAPHDVDSQVAFLNHSFAVVDPATVMPSSAPATYDASGCTTPTPLMPTAARAGRDATSWAEGPIYRQIDRQKLPLGGDRQR
jgi:hypothetical protein